MSKKRKTRREKIIAANRRPSLNYVFETPLPKVHVREIVEQITNPAQTTTPLYAYVIKDVRHTIFTTSLIAAINIVLFLILKLKIVSLFGIVF